MSKPASNELKRGQTVAFRIPSDTPDHLLKQLQKLRETEKRNFSSKIAEFVLQGVGKAYEAEKESITIPLPLKLTKLQRDWLKHAHSEALLGNIVHQLISDPVRTASLFASLNGSKMEINEDLYLQEEVENEPIEIASSSELAADIDEDDLDSFDWNHVTKETSSDDEEDSESVDDLLGGFLDSMNK